MAYNVAEDSPTDHIYEEASVILRKKTKTNKSCHTREAKVVSSTSTRKLSKEEIHK